MARVKRSVHGKKSRRKVLESASGYRGARSRSVRKANEQVMHSGNYALPRPAGAQGRVPQALDRAHQRGLPSARHVVLAVRRRPEGGGDRHRPQDPRRPRGARRRRLRRPRVRGAGSPRTCVTTQTARQRERAGQAAACAAARPEGRVGPSGRSRSRGLGPSTPRSIGAHRLEVAFFATNADVGLRGPGRAPRERRGADRAPEGRRARTARLHGHAPTGARGRAHAVAVARCAGVRRPRRGRHRARRSRKRGHVVAQRGSVGRGGNPAE